nr:hypothetical protein 24 [Burkholderiaceae bacterium]
MEEKQEELSMEDAQRIWDEEAKRSENSAEDDFEEIEETSPDDNDDSGEVEEPPQEEETEEVVAEEKVASDPFEGLPDAVKQKLAKIDELEKSNQTLLHHIKTAEGRVSALQREQDIARRVQEQVAKQNNEAPTQKEIAKAEKDPEKWARLKEDFPEWAEGLEEYVSTRLGGMQQPQQTIDAKQIEGYVNNQINASRTEMTRRIEEATLDGRHPSWRDDVKSQDFNNWLTNQPNEVRVLADSQAAKDAIRMMDLFYESKKTPATDIKQSRSQKLVKAANPSRKGQTPPPKSLDDMTPQELWNYEARQREKTREARGF